MKITVIGAGNVGSSVAYALILREIAALRKRTRAYSKHSCFKFKYRFTLH